MDTIYLFQMKVITLTNPLGVGLSQQKFPDITLATSDNRGSVVEAHRNFLIATSSKLDELFIRSSRMWL